MKEPDWLCSLSHLTVYYATKLNLRGLCRDGANWLQMQEESRLLQSNRENSGSCRGGVLLMQPTVHKEMTGNRQSTDMSYLHMRLAIYSLNKLYTTT